MQVPRRLLWLWLWLVLLCCAYLHIRQSTLASRSDKSVAKTRPTCSQHLSCSSCAWAFTECTWCVSTASCIPLASVCSDFETGYCSSVLLYPIQTRHRVIYVGKRSGGPEALVQLHLALLHWGFNSTLETRKKQVGKSLLPFFREAYNTEFTQYGVRMVKSHDYFAFLKSATSRDLIILTETWPCLRGLRFDHGTGARQIQYHLTIQDRRSTYDISHMYIPDAYPEECAVFTHTHYMTKTFLNQSRKATIIPYISPHIEAAAATQWQGYSAVSHAKRNVILYDGDARFDPSQVDTKYRSMLVKAASIKPKELYRLYSAALCVIDFEMPGAERLVLEAALFGTPIVINDELNGADGEDFPIPSRYRIRGRDYAQLNNILSLLTTARDNGRFNIIVDEFEEFRRYVRSLRGNFLRAVRQYFSDSIHFTLSVGEHDDWHLVRLIIASVVCHLPLGTISLSFETDHVQEVFKQASQSFFAVLHRQYLTSSISLSVNDRKHTIAPQALFQIEVLKANCFIASYQFTSIVAAAFHTFGGSNPQFVAELGSCFRITMDRSSRLKPLSIPLPQAQLSFVMREEEFYDLPHLASDPLWRSLVQIF